MAGSFDFLHIKRRTEGSFNELSFDVLDSKSAKADVKSGRSKLAKPPKASKGSYHGVAGGSTLSGQVEVEKRKKARQVYRLRLRFLAAVMAVVLLGTAVFVGMRVYEARMDVAGRIDILVSRLSDVDKTLVVVDALMGDPLDSEQAGERRAMLGEIPAMTIELNRILVDVKSMDDLSLDNNAEVVVGQLGKAAQSRTSMFNAATEAFRLSAEASDQVSRANSAWNDVLKADQLTREAISVANKATTQDAANQALSMLREARDGFDRALSDLQDIGGSYGVDFADQNAYLQKRIEALDNAVAASEALLSANRDEAQRATDAYNEADAAAAHLAEALPPSIADIVEGQFAKDMADVQGQYNEARNLTVEADSVIRDYLGR